MVIEHSFVTTLEAAPAMEAAHATLRRHGFARSTFGAADSVELRRGKTSASRAKTVAELPQAVRIHWDRGRVTMALSIDNYAMWGAQASLTGSSNSKKLKLHTELLTAIAVALEKVLVHRLPIEMAAADWDRIEKDIIDTARRRTRRMWIIFAIIMAVFAAIITTAIMAS